MSCHLNGATPANSMSSKTSCFGILRRLRINKPDNFKAFVLRSIDKSSPIKGGQDAQNNNICNSASLSLSEEGRCDKSGLAEFMDENSESN